MRQTTKAVAGTLSILAGFLLITFSFYAGLVYVIAKAARFAWGSCG